MPALWTRCRHLQCNSRRFILSQDQDSRHPFPRPFQREVDSGKTYRASYFKDPTFDALRLIEPVAQKHNLTLVEVAVRWIVHHSSLRIKNGRDGVFIGVSSYAQLKGNLNDLEKGPLSDEVVRVPDEAWLIAKAKTPN